MSLIDTINGAKKEAEANSVRTDKGADANDDAKKPRNNKRSAAGAKPAREAAAGVRVAKSGSHSSGKPASEMTKEEKKAARREERDAADRRAAAQRALLNQMPGYKKTQRVWWILLGIGLVATLISWLMGQYIPTALSNPTSPEGIVMIALMVLAYVVIIAAFIYDWRTVRPMRKAADAQANSLTDKKVNQILRNEADEAARKQSEKDKAKAARRGSKSQRHEQHK